MCVFTSQLYYLQKSQQTSTQKIRIFSTTLVDPKVLKQAEVGL